MTTIRTEHRLSDTREMRADLTRLAINLKRVRTRAGLSMQALARKVGCSHYVIAHVEQGQNFPSWPVYSKICKVLDAGKLPLT